MKKLFLNLILALISIATNAKTLQGIVTYVGDGDTVWIEVDRNAKPVKLRLQDLDAPEICQAGGIQARDALKARLLRQSVSFDTRARDDYARAVGRVQHRGEDIGAWLVKSGHAWSYTYRRKPAPYAAELAAAKNARAGLWATAGALEPREFRKANGACKKIK